MRKVTQKVTSVERHNDLLSLNIQIYLGIVLWPIIVFIQQQLIFY